MNDSEQNSQPNCNSSDRIGSNNIVNEIIPINLNNNQNIDIGNSEKDRNSNNEKLFVQSLIIIISKKKKIKQIFLLSCKNL